MFDLSLKYLKNDTETLRFVYYLYQNSTKKTGKKIVDSRKNPRNFKKANKVAYRVISTKHEHKRTSNYLLLSFYYD
ncbi:MAG TPA: hypothetical protein DEQ84_05425 [Prevotellaceae bacterium]|nr:hypothetical protein [Prevotellaceae bacterium]